MDSMTSADLGPPAPLKGKLSQVKHLLDNASKQLQEQASNYAVFSTRASAGLSQDGKQLGESSQIDLTKTIDDISTINSILSCPIFDRIVNVTNSLDNLSHQLNLHPSIGPSDISIDANGELILSPPIDIPPINNIDNYRHDNFNGQLFSQAINTNYLPTNGDPLLSQPFVNCNNFSGSLHFNGDGQHKQQLNHVINQMTELNSQSQSHYQREPTTLPQNQISHTKSDDQEKLIATESRKIQVRNYAKNSNQVFQDLSNVNGNTGEENNQRLYRSYGNFELNQVDSTDSRANHSDSKIVSDIRKDNHETLGDSYSNEVYEATQEFEQCMSLSPQMQQPLEQMRAQAFTNANNRHAVANDMYNNQNPKSELDQRYTNGDIIRSSCSPSTSVGSTVRLADECDSGASSYQSQTTKPMPYQTSYSYQPKSMNEAAIKQPVVNEAAAMSSTMSSAVADLGVQGALWPVTERIKVTLEKDSKGMGIQAAGYTVETQEISGIFVRDINPNGPADQSGKIKILDQIIAINGRKLHEYSNPEAFKVLRNTGRVVTLELQRFVDESMTRKLGYILSQVEPTFDQSSIRRTPDSPIISSNQESPSKNRERLLQSPSKTSRIPVTASRSNSQDVRNDQNYNSMVSAKPVFVQISGSSNGSKGGSFSETTSGKSIISVKSGSVSSNPDYEIQNSSVPSAARRDSGPRQVIETKQGARNTIDIRSPACQAPVISPAGRTSNQNSQQKMPITDGSRKSMVARLQDEASDELNLNRLVNEPEWEKNVQIIELHKDPSQGLGFSMKQYADPTNRTRTIIMITSLSENGIAARDGRLAIGDLLIFVDDTSLEEATLADAVKALKKANGSVRLGVLKLKTVS